MGAVGREELARWEKMEGMAEAAGGGDGDGGKLERICVSVRLRPLNEKEVSRNDQSDWECINETTIIFRNTLPERSMFPTAYTFDRVFGCECPTRQVYEEGAKEVALSVVSGINSSIFAYGQTSSGKTYTMTGITEYAVADIYDYIYRHEERAFVLKFSAMEIYNEAVKDLLSTDSTPLRVLDDPEKGTIVEKLTEQILRDRNQLLELITVCQAQRKIGETSLNETSSRSHQILRLTIESSAREFLGKDNSSSLVASVNFVDLAGSERASQALSTGARLKEGCHINRSLLTLGTVIRKLSKGRIGHIPYRDSKLTRILQPSLGGNARTAIICTMSPARSHVEQSRNTLLFASCAKEVATSAQVNVVMSDKALVRHLQKELARLENELRCPPATASSAEALLREKEAYIRKMEKEMKELIRERNLAQSRLEDLLQVVEEERASRQWEETSQTSTFQNSHYLRLSHKQKNQDVISPSYSIGSSMLVGPIHHESGEESIQNPNGNLEDLCKEVRCIEMDEPRRSVDSSSSLNEGSQSLLTMVVDSPKNEEQEPKPKEQINSRGLGASPSFITLEQHLQDFRKTLNNFDRTYPDESSPWSSVRDSSSSRGWLLGRSRSCRSTLMSSSWFHELEQNDKTPPGSFLRDIPGRSEGFQRRRIALNYGEEAEMLQKQESQASTLSISDSTHEGHISKTTASDEDIVGIGDFVAGLKEMAQAEYQKQHTDQGQDANGDNTKNENLDSVSSPVESPSRWPLEFEKKQLEIIELWHACNVSLIHRTYFFLLFKGDPADSIYIEVELRRLSFLKNAFPRANVDKTLTENGQNDTLALSTRALRRERDMLCKQMYKRLSAAERESLYTKWGIAWASKQRRVQLSRRLWSSTNDLEHVRESALLVARLIGLLEPGKALKEMFGLSFTPQRSHRRSYNWRHGMSSIK